MLCQLAETAAMHCMPTFQVNGCLLAAEQVVFLADGARTIQGLGHMSVAREVIGLDARVAVEAVGEILSAALATDAAALAVIILFIGTVHIEDATFGAKVARKLGIAMFALARYLQVKR